ncbi:hypothetical protein ACHQM5_013578 [Ranunculus cassubicifolius]
MMQHQLFQPSWEYYNPMEIPIEMDTFMDDCELSSAFAITEDSSDVSSTHYFPTITPDEFHDFCEGFSYTVPSQQNSPNSDGFSLVSNDQATSNVFDTEIDWIKEIEGSTGTNLLPDNLNFTDEDKESSILSRKSANTSPIKTSSHASLVLPKEDMEVDNQLSIPSLIKAYGEAIEYEQAELAEVILRHAKEMVSPIGSTLERLAHYFFQDSESQDDYLRQESSTNYAETFRALYQIVPHGRFAHLTANMAILQSIPVDVESIHIIDFDMGNGVQFSSLIEAIGKGWAVRLTSIRWKEDCDFPRWDFQDAKMRLCNHAQTLGLKLEMDEMDMEELGRELRKTKSIDTKREWLVFNCMVGLPHMGRQRSRRLVTKFIKVAKELISHKGGSGTQGTIITGEGDGVEKRMRNCCGFGDFLDENMVQFHALLQSIDCHFPPHLTEAKLAIENIFLAPYISSATCYQRWNELGKNSGLETVTGLESRRFSIENFLQAKEIVQEGSSMYSMKVDEVCENAISLCFRGTSLVKVSVWR